jgi:GrpB-like predicted nucleotidyltransferase (UPF0157 family)
MACPALRSTRIVARIRIRPESEIRKAAQSAFVEHRGRVLRLLPDAEVEHVGSTAIPGALTKGDVDVLVRVTIHDFDDAVSQLRSMYAVHQPHNWTPTLASFADRDADDPPVGVQLVVAGSADDRLFGPFREALIRDPALLAAYNALKRSHDGDHYQHYTDVKGEFVRDVLARVGRRSA